ncbi:MAG: hypothetical protein ACT4NY_28025 [Pseudonocardiales bacterium]
MLSDLDGDGLADIGEFDTDADGYSDVLAIDTGRDGVADIAFVDSDYDGYADTVVTADDSAVVTTNSSGDIYDVPNYDAPSGTQAVIDMVNSGMKDAGTIYRDAADPGSVSAEEIAAASERIDNAAQHSRALEGSIYQQEVANEIRSDELTRQTVEEAQRTATDVWIENERAISRADDML